MEEIQNRIEKTDIDKETAVRILRSELSWKDWILQDWLRYWYGVGALALDVFIVLWLLLSFNLRDILGILMMLVMLAILVVVEIKGYRLLWPGGVLSRR